MKLSSSCARNSRGFTLVELVITVAIVAILAAIAYPNYVEFVRKSRRAEARTQLLEAAQFMQRFYTQNDRFDQDTGGTATSLPTVLRQVPRDAAVSYYTVRLAAGGLAASAFTLEAAPTGAMANDRCGTLQLTNTGRKLITGGAAGVVAETCWR